MTIRRILDRPRALVCIALLGTWVGVRAEADTAAPAPAPIPEARAFVSEHSARFNGERVDYRVDAGETYVLDKHGKPQASIFTFSYAKTNVSTNAMRPVTFVWNGGPGSASLWLHMGTFGPQRISLPSDAEHPGAPPYSIVAAPETILDVTDLVFVDPVGTGFSRALGEHESKEFWGLNEDARSIAEFIETWVTANGRWNSPKFLLGESFGTTRAAKVANILEGERMMGLNGLIFVSQALDYTGSSPYYDHNLIAYVTYVPTMAATAAYHGKIDPEPDDLEAFLQASREFATGDLLPALFRATVCLVPNSSVSGTDLPGLPVSAVTTSKRPICVSTDFGSPRNCCATRDVPSGCSMHAIPANSWIGSRPASPATRPAMRYPPPSSRH